MVINKITIKNFYRFGNQEQVLDLNGSGITAITGINGVGKSSCIVDALNFALFGKYRDTIDGVVNRYVGKNCKVGVEFTEGGETYKVLRYRKHDTHNNNVYLFKGDKDISGHTVSETNNLILDKIKINYVAFTNSSVFSSELYSAFLANKVSERLVIFENILSLKEVNTFYAQAKDFLKQLGKKKEEENVIYNRIDADISSINNTIEAYSNNAKSKLVEMKSKKESLKKSIEEIKLKNENYLSIDIEKEKGKLSNNIIKANTERRIRELLSEKEKLVVVRPVDALRIADKYKDVDFFINKAKEEKYKEDLETINARKNGYTLEQEKLASLNQKKAVLTKEKEGYVNENRELKLRIEKLNLSLCPFCGQHMATEHAQQELDNANKKINSNLASIKEVDKELEDLELSIKESRENYEYLLKDYNSLNEKLDKNFIPNSDLIEEQYKNAIMIISNCEEEEKRNGKRLEEIAAEIKDLEKQLDELLITPYSEEELKNMENIIKSNKEAISEMEKEISMMDGSALTIYDKSYVEGLKANVEAKTKELEEARERLNKLNKSIVHFEFLADCFSNKAGGFKKYFIGEMIDVFNKYINRYLAFFFNEKVSITFDRDLNETITMDDFEVSFSSFSQGQRQRAELAINFALFDVARIFFSNDNKLLILDEMDKGLDKFGIKAMVNVLNGFDKQLRIFIVSHNPLLESEVDDKVVISRDSNEFSVINQ